MTTLISFLGKSQADSLHGYRLANYRFTPDVIQTTPFFGTALLKYLRPEKLVLVGTASSMWDVFFYQQDIKDDDDIVQLIEAVEKDATTQEMLSSYEKRLSEHLGVSVRCVLIPHARDTNEQVEILSHLTQALERGDPVVLDVTHSYRHLPMLALVAARYLTHVHGIQISNIYYGAMDMTDPDTKETPVLELNSMLKMLDWIEAQAVYHKSGDYGVFADLLVEDGMEENTAAMIARGSFFERNANPVKAQKALNNILEHIEGHNGAIGSLFRKTLVNNINWVKKNRRYEWELSLAERYLERQDYLRATTYLFEGMVSKYAYKEKLDHNCPDDRKEAQTKAEKSIRDINRLTHLRNALVHGARSENKEINRLLSNPAELDEKLKHFYRLVSRLSI